MGRAIWSPGLGTGPTAATKATEAVPWRGWVLRGLGVGLGRGGCRYWALWTTWSPSGDHVLLDIRVVDLGGDRNAALGPLPLRLRQYQGEGVGDEGDPAQEAATASCASLYLPPWREHPP